MLTTGFDAPHVDLIAILRPTESVSLYQQIVGRGLRLAPGKTDCLILDYAGNPHDLYAPEVGSPKGKSDNVPVRYFARPAALPTPSGKTTADGTLIEHFGRRCVAGLTMMTAIASSAIFAFASKTARSVMPKTILPPDAAGNVTPFWSTRTIC